MITHQIIRIMKLLSVSDPSATVPPSGTVGIVGENGCFTAWGHAPLVISLMEAPSDRLLYAPSPSMFKGGSPFVQLKPVLWPGFVNREGMIFPVVRFF